MFKNWKVEKGIINYYGNDKEKQAEAETARKEYPEVAEWCNKSGEYHIEDQGIYYAVVENPKPTFDELKEAKRAEINQDRTEAEQGGFSYMGKVFDSDQVSAQRISMAAQAMALAPEGTTITWTCQDNTTIDLTAQELVGLVVALAEWSNTCHQKATELKAQIDACESEEELELITWKESNSSDSVMSKAESEVI